MLYVGAPAAPTPAYDLAAVLARGSGEKPAEARLGALVENPRYAPAAAPLPPFTERHQGALTAALAVLLAALAVWTVRLLRRGDARA